MQISVEVLFQVIGLLGSILGIVWYISSMIGDLKRQIAESNQLNSMQEQKIDKTQSSIEDTSNQCRDGRIKVWEDLNQLKVKVAALEARMDRERN